MNIYQAYISSLSGKRTYRLILLFFFIHLFFLGALFSQQVNKANLSNKGWSTTNPFKTDVFVQNYGQFDNWAKSSLPVKYAVNSNEKIFFTQQGLIYKLNIAEEDDHESEAVKPDKISKRDKEEKEHHVKTKSYFVAMDWEGCNKNATIETAEETNGYYTYGEKGYESIKAKGYKKLVYKNLYPNIDVEYTFPENKEGIKYKLILHPGANPDVVKMHYTGDIKEIKKDTSGNIVIETPAGIITDHAPKSFYEADNKILPSAFRLEKNTITFKLVTPNSQLKTIIIDPWTTVPTTLATDNAAYDIDFDNNGNVYVTGGTTPFKLAKYSNIGSLIWTFTNPISWAPEYSGYSKFCLIPKSGTVYIGEGWNGSGPRIMKINSNGVLATTSPNYAGSEEIWVMFYNRCNSQICGFGGGTQTPNNMQQVADTNLTTSNVACFNGYPSAGNDIASVQMDYNGDFYALAPSMLYGVAGPNSLTKSLFSTYYSPPCYFDVNSGYSFSEGMNYGIPGLFYLISFTNRANALALNVNYIYSYDGYSLKAWDKTNGNQLASIIVDPSHLGGAYRTHEGIAADDCNNIFVGGTNKVHVFSFDGSSFTPQTPIINGISNEVYDIKLDQVLGTLYVCGQGFVTMASANSCITNQLALIVDGECSNSVTVTASGGTSPYNYIWSNGNTTNNITGAPGTYTVTVTDNSCKTLKAVETVHICSLLIPNVFTPNGDNQNDVFEVLYDGYEPYDIKIFNRWGIKLFESNDKNTHWNGKTAANRDAPDGVYFYILTIGAKSYNGTVTLIR